MKFVYPELLWLMLIAPVAIVWLVHFEFRRRGAALLRFASLTGLRRQGVHLGGWSGRQIFRIAILGAAAVLLVIAAARPQWGFSDRRIVSHGADIIVAVDTSLSMLATDASPNRLDKAKNLLQNILWESEGDRIGVVAYAANATVLCPLTLDYNMAAMSLQTITPETLSAGGTNIAEAIRMSREAFNIAGTGERILLLLTDGEDQGSGYAVEAAEAAKNGIKILSIGIGTETGSAIPLQRGLKLDREGRTVVTKRNMTTLEELATATNGVAVEAAEEGLGGLRTILSTINDMDGKQQQDRVFRVWKERFQWFLLPALLLLLLEAIMASHTVARRSALTILMAALIGVNANAQVANPVPGPAAGQVPVDSNTEKLAMENFSKGEYGKAAEQYKKIQSSRGDSPHILYNLGTSLARAGETTEAVNLLNEAHLPRNPSFNSAAQYNAATTLHNQVRQEVEAKVARESEEGAAMKDPKTELQPTMTELERAIDLYRGALLKQPSDDDVRRNLELAMRDRDQLNQMMNPGATPTPTPTPKSEDEDQDTSQPQEEQPKQNDQQKEQGQQEQQQNNQDQSNEGKGQNKDGQPPSATPSPTPGSDAQATPTPAPTPSPTPGNEGEAEGTPTPAPKGTPSPTPGAGQATPTPAPKVSPTPGAQGSPTPAPTGTPQSGTGTAAASEGETGEAASMTEADVERLLNTLPEDDPNAIQRFFGRGSPNPTDEMERDW